MKLYPNRKSYIMRLMSFLYFIGCQALLQYFMLKSILKLWSPSIYDTKIHVHNYFKQIHTSVGWFRELNCTWINISDSLGVFLSVSFRQIKSLSNQQYSFTTLSLYLSEFPSYYYLHYFRLLSSFWLLWSYFNHCSFQPSSGIFLLNWFVKNQKDYLDIL